MMTTLFLSTNTSGFRDAKTGKIDAAYTTLIKELAASLRTKGFAVFCGLDADPSAFPDNSIEGIVAVDLEQIRKASILLALILSLDISAGQQLELGYASGLGKKVFIATPANTKLLFMNHGMVKLGLITHFTYADINQLPEDIMREANHPSL